MRCDPFSLSDFCSIYLFSDSPVQYSIPFERQLYSSKASDWAVHQIRLLTPSYHWDHQANFEHGPDHERGLNPQNQILNPKKSSETVSSSVPRSQLPMYSMSASLVWMCGRREIRSLRCENSEPGMVVGSRRLESFGRSSLRGSCIRSSMYSYGYQPRTCLSCPVNLGNQFLMVVWRLSRDYH